MVFIPPLDTWVNSHYIDVPNRTIEAIGALNGKTILDVGCGELLTAFGLLHSGASKVVGIDVKELPHSLVENTLERLNSAGFHQARQDRSRLSTFSYDGNLMPFSDDEFDIVFSWGVFEHVTNVETVLREMRRVLRPNGICFIKVFPWFHSFYGSHLSDFLDEPFAHLKYDPEILKEKLIYYLNNNPDIDKNLILNHVWPEYLTLNKYSANMFYKDVKKAGFSSDIWKLTAYPQDLSEAPPGYELSDLMVCDSEVILRK